MRFAVDQNFPNTIVEGHVLVQNMIVAMGLADLVVAFDESPQRMYYLRGTTVFEDSLSTTAALQGIPYGFNSEFLDFAAGMTTPTLYTADNLLGAIAGAFAPGLGSPNADRPGWCNYYANRTVGSSAGTTAFPTGTPVRDIGYWNLLYDQFGDEGFDYTPTAPATRRT